MIPIAILAGGFAKRLGQLTEKIPKSLIEVNGKPFIDWQLNLLSRKGFSKIVLCVSHRADLIREYVGDGSKFDLELNYSEDGPVQLGTGGAIKKALPLLGDKFMVLYGDSFLDVDYHQIGSYFEKSNKPALMTVYKNFGNFDKSNIKFDSSGRLIYNKKITDTGMEYIDFGLNLFRKEVFEEFPMGAIFDLSDFCEILARVHRIEGYQVFSRFYEVGSLKGIKDLSMHLIKEQNEFY